MDFPSSKCFCSTAGQIRPQQHAWPQTTAAHPQQLRPAVCAALAPAPAPGGSAPVSPFPERPDQLRVQRTSFLLETRTGSGD